MEGRRGGGVPYASSSCFIFVYSSFVIDSSPAERSNRKWTGREEEEEEEERRRRRRGGGEGGGGG